MLRERIVVPAAPGVLVDGLSCAREFPWYSVLRSNRTENSLKSPFSWWFRPKWSSAEKGAAVTNRQEVPFTGSAANCVSAIARRRQEAGALGLMVNIIVLWNTL